MVKKTCYILREIRQIMKKNKWIEEWNKQYQQYKGENCRKRLLMEELGKFRAGEG